MKGKFIILSLCLLHNSLFAQKQKADSLLQLLKTETKDTAKVKLLWKLASTMGVYSPDTALIYAQKSLLLATEIKYAEGQSKAIGVLANTFRKMGNYSKALEYNFRKLPIAENFGFTPNAFAACSMMSKPVKAGAAVGKCQTKLWSARGSVPRIANAFAMSGT